MSGISPTLAYVMGIPLIMIGSILLVGAIIAPVARLRSFPCRLDDPAERSDFDAAGVAATLVLNAFQSNLVFFFTPSQVAAKEAPQGRPFRIGGMVETGSLAREPNSLTVHFRVTDTVQIIPVTYTGMLPDLFKEGKGVVAQGSLFPDGAFHATEVLAKHDANYMPPDAKAAVDQAKRGMSMKSLQAGNGSGQ